MSAGAWITRFACLDESMQFILPIFEADPHIGRAACDPIKAIVIPKTLMLIKRSDRAKHTVVAFKADRGVALTSELRGERIEEILRDLPKLEIRIQCEEQPLRPLDLIWLWRSAGAARKDETKNGQRNPHNASIKREERSSVNRCRRNGPLLPCSQSKRPITSTSTSRSTSLSRWLADHQRTD